MASFDVNPNNGIKNLSDIKQIYKLKAFWNNYRAFPIGLRNEDGTFKNEFDDIWNVLASISESIECQNMAIQKINRA